jgi:hypothetical protein
LLSVNQSARQRMVNLENAYWNIMARPVVEEYWRQTQFLNRVNVPFVRSVMPSPALAPDLLKVRAAGQLRRTKPTVH